MERLFFSLDADIYLASFQGQTIECATAEDAITIKFAERVLHNGETVSPAQLGHAVVVLRCYGCYTAANILSGRLARLRAADYLRSSAGYVHHGGSRPK